MPTPRDNGPARPGRPVTIRRRAALSAACLLALLPGCRGAPVARYDAGIHDSDILSVAPNEHGLLVGELRDQTLAVSAQQLWEDGLQTGERRFLVFSEGERYQARRVIETHPDGSRTLREVLPDGSVPFEARLRLDEGAIWTDQSRSGEVTTAFTPGAMFLPAQMGDADLGARRFETAFDARSWGGPIGAGSVGTGTVVVTYSGAQRIEVPAGGFDAIVLDSELRMKAGPARIAISRQMWLAPGVGLVAQVKDERVTVLGFQVRRDQRVMVLDTPTSDAEQMP